MPNGSEVNVTVSGASVANVSVPGATGTTPTITNGGVANVNVTSVGDRGPKGDAGSTVNLGDETPQPAGTPSAGTAATAARSDHVHAVPTIAYSNLTGVPSAFSPASHTHQISQVTGLQAALDSLQPAGTYATLDGSGRVPSSQLPSYVDDVTEYTNLAAFPGAGETGKIYVARDTNRIYRWSGSTYIEISLGDVVALSDDAPQSLGTGSPGVAALGSRADHVHPMPTAADIGALTIESSVDGGDFIGILVDPGGTIKIATQPASQTVTVGSVFSQTSSLPSGTWNPEIAYVNGQYIAVADDATGGDYYATSTDGVAWTKRYGFQRPGRWRTALYGGGKYAVSNGTYIQVSTDGLTWTEQNSPGTLHHANGKWLRYVFDGAATTAAWDACGLYVSDDLVTWSALRTVSHSVPAGTAVVGGGTTTSTFNYKPNTISAVVYFDGKYIAFGDGGSISTVSSGGQVYYRGVPFIWTSTDAETWTRAAGVGGHSLIETNGWAATIAGSSPSSSVRFTRPQVVNGDLWVSGGADVSPTFFKSANGTSWTAITMPLPSGTTNSPTNVAYGGGTYVVAHNFKVYSSTNGTTWTERTVPDSGSGATSAEAHYIDGVFWVVGRSTAATLRSENGADWTTVSGVPQINAKARVVVGTSLLSTNSGTVTQAIKITFAAASAAATFSVVASYSQALSYQWQLSTDAGSTWSAITGATAASLVLAGLTTSDSGKRYRVVVSGTGATSVTSNSATLTVN